MGIFGLSLATGSDIDGNSWQDVVVAASDTREILVFGSRARLRANCQFRFATDYTNRVLQKDSLVPVEVSVTLSDPRKRVPLSRAGMKALTDPRSQISLDLNRTDNPLGTYFELTSDAISSHIDQILLVRLELRALQGVTRMDLKKPVIISYRFIQGCDTKEKEEGRCSQLQFPLIDWSSCHSEIPLKKYICLSNLPCRADLLVQLVDSAGSEVEYGYQKSFSRSLTLTVVNRGPTEAKDIRFRLQWSSPQLKIHRLNINKTLDIKEHWNKPQREFMGEIRDLEVYVGEKVNISVDIFFNNVGSMNYLNNTFTASVFCDIDDDNLSNNEAQILYQFVYAPNVSFAGSSNRETVVDSRNRSTYISLGQRVGVDQIGPRMSHEYRLFNQGRSTIRDLDVVVSLPVQSAGTRGDIGGGGGGGRSGNPRYNLLYLFDRIRGVNSESELRWVSIVPYVSILGGTGDSSGGPRWPCRMPEHFTNQMGIIPFETHASHMIDFSYMAQQLIGDSSLITAVNLVQRLPQIASFTSPSGAETQKENSKRRFKRTLGTDDTTTSNTTAAGSMEFTKGKMNRMLTEIIQCGRPGMGLKGVVCADIICRVPELPPNKELKLQINAWLWANTFFKYQISDIMVYATVRLDLDKGLPEGVRLRPPQQSQFHHHQRFVFSNVNTTLSHLYLIWPIVVGLVVGILILAMLVVAMYKCGFFRRTKRHRRLSSRNRGPGAGKGHVIVHQHDLTPSPTT